MERARANVDWRESRPARFDGRDDHHDCGDEPTDWEFEDDDATGEPGAGGRVTVSRSRQGSINLWRRCANDAPVREPHDGRAGGLSSAWDRVRVSVRAEGQ